MKALASRWMLMTALMVGTVFFITTVEPPEADAQTRRRKRRKKKKKTQAIAGFNLGMVALGTATDTTVAGGRSNEVALTEKSLYAVGGYVLFPVSKQVYIGANIDLVPSLDLRPEQNQVIPDETGTQYNINFQGEYRKSFSGITAFFYGTAGLAVISPATYNSGPEITDNYTGLNFGGGGGVHFKLSKGFYARGGLDVNLYQVTTTYQNGSTTNESSLSGQRVMLKGGLAFGL